MSLVSLPQELLRLVITSTLIPAPYSTNSITDADQYTTSHSTQDLVNLALTCKHLYHSVVPVLWRHIVFDQQNPASTTLHQPITVKSYTKDWILLDPEQNSYENEIPALGQCNIDLNSHNAGFKNDDDDDFQDDDEAYDDDENDDEDVKDQQHHQQSLQRVQLNCTAKSVSESGLHIQSQPTVTSAASANPTITQHQRQRRRQTKSQTNYHDLFTKALLQNQISPFAQSTIRTITFAMPTGAQSPSCNNAYPSTPPYAIATTTTNKDNLVPLFLQAASSYLVNLDQINIVDYPSSSTISSGACDTILESLKLVVYPEPLSPKVTARTKVDNQQYQYHQYRHTRHRKCNIRLYNTSLSRLEEFKELGLASFVNDLNIALSPPPPPRRSTTNERNVSDVDVVETEGEYTRFKRVVEQDMIQSLERLTITDLFQSSASSPPPSVPSVLPSSLPPSPSPFSSSSILTSNHDQYLRHQENEYKALQSALQQLVQLKSLTVPNSINKVFAMDWVPPRVEVFNCWSLFEKMWQPPANQQRHPTLTTNGATDVDDNDGNDDYDTDNYDDDGTSHNERKGKLSLKITTLHLSLPTPLPATMFIPFRTLTNLHFWTQTPEPLFVKAMVTASRSTLVNVYLSHCDAVLLGALGRILGGCLDTTSDVAMGIKTNVLKKLVVDDFEYLDTSGSLIVASTGQTNTSSTAGTLGIDQQQEISTNPDGNAVASIGGIGAGNTSDDEPPEEPLVPAVAITTPTPAAITYSQAIIQFLKACPHLHTLVLTISPFDQPFFNPLTELQGYQLPPIFYLKLVMMNHYHHHLHDDSIQLTTTTTPCISNTSKSLSLLPVDRSIISTNPLFHSYSYYFNDPHLKTMLNASFYQVLMTV